VVPILQVIQHHHRPQKSNANRSRAQAPQDQLNGGAKPHAQTNPSSRGTRILPPVQNKHKNIGFQRQRIFHSSNPVLQTRSGRGENRRKATTLVTNQQHSLSITPPATATPTGARHTKSQKGAAEATSGVGEAWRKSESCPTCCRFISHTQAYAPLRP
jgi:hypothetical protein